MIDSSKCYWVYLPSINEAGFRVYADDFEDAAIVGCNALCPDDGDAVRVYYLGGSNDVDIDGPLPVPFKELLGKAQNFIAGEIE